MRAKFSTALLLAIAGLLLVIMAAVAVVGSKILRDTITDSARQSVTTASQYFRQQLGVRAEEVAGAVSVLVEDFGFRDALASGDHATILSAVDNQSSRIGATAYSIRMSDGRTISAADTPYSVSGLAGNEMTMTVKVTAINNLPHLIISTPVGNPTILGMLTLGFEMSDSFVDQMKELVGADISFVAGPSGASERGLFSTLPDADNERDARQRIATMEAVTAGLPSVLTIADQRFMTTRVDLQSAELFDAYLHVPMTDEASAFRKVGIQLSLLGGGAFLLVLVMSSWLSRRLTRPLGELGAAAAKIGGGNYRVAIPKQSIREFSQLGDAFGVMQKAVDEREQAIFQQARLDDLTGLPNRLAAIECITRLIDNGKVGSPFVLLSVDIHHLREINDSLGHDTGDNLLRWLGRTLQANSLRDSTVCRIASDDFLVIMPRANETDAHSVAKQLFKATESSAQLDKDLKARIRINIGASLFPAHGQGPEALIRAAEQAMYKAKEQRSILQVYDAGDDARRKRRLDLAYSLRSAIANNEISLSLQPSIAFANPLEVYADVLLNWENPAYGNIAIDEFISLAENSGQIADLNAWVLERTCSLIADLQRRRVALPVTINVSRHDLEDPGFVTRFIETCGRHGIEKSMFTLQISEGLAASSLEQARETLSRLRRQRVRIAIGHFGSGRSSLALLRDLAVDEIRIDRSFFQGNLKIISEKAIVESIVQLAHQLGIQVVAEGVESKELLAMLKTMDVDGAQGHFLSRPLPPQQFEIWRESWISSKRRNSQ